MSVGSLLRIIDNLSSLFVICIVYMTLWDNEVKDISTKNDYPTIYMYSVCRARGLGVGGYGV